MANTTIELSAANNLLWQHAASHGRMPHEERVVRRELGGKRILVFGRGGGLGNSGSVARVFQKMEGEDGGCGLVRPV